MTSSLKISLILSGLILAVGGAAGWNQRGRLRQLEADDQSLRARAALLGIAIDADEARVTKRPRANATLTPETMAGLLAAARELKDSDSSEGEEVEAKARALLEKLMGLNADQMQAWLDALRVEGGLPDGTRRDLIVISLNLLAEDRPGAALEWFASAGENEVGGWLGDQFLASTLGKWAQQDPAAASAWLLRNLEHPKVDKEEAERYLIAGSARTDPKVAFKLLAELKPDDPSSVIDAMAGEAETLERKAALLAALRDHVAGLPDDGERDGMVEGALEEMARNLGTAPAGAVQAWLDGAKLEKDELAGFVSGLSYSETGKDTAAWMAWIAEKLPEDAMRGSIGDLMGQWTEQDYQAAGRWLDAEPAGAAKSAAVASYASTVAEYDPKVAVQWADTLPAGESRQETYQKIYDNWPLGDRESADAFARAHGLEMEEKSEEGSTMEERLRVIEAYLDEARGGVGSGGKSK